MTALLIIDDDPAVRAKLPGYFAGSEVTTSAVGTARHAFEALAAATYNVVLADTRLPDVDGVELITSLARISPQLPVVGFAADDTDEHVIGVLRAGARGIVLTSAPPAEVLNAVREAASGRVHISPDVAGRLGAYLHQPAPPAADLTWRERHVLSLLLDGLDNQTIALEAGISVGAVKKNLAVLYRKYDVDSRLALAVVALTGRKQRGR